MQVTSRSARNLTFDVRFKTEMMTRLLSITVLAAMLLSGRAMLTHGPPLDVTVSELLAHPERYHGKHVAASGYYTFSFEHSVVYPSESLKYHAPDKGVLFMGKYPMTCADEVWVDSPGFFAKHDLTQHVEFPAVVTGIFETGGNKGHMGGSLHTIRRARVQEHEESEPKPDGDGLKPAP